MFDIVGPPETEQHKEEVKRSVKQDVKPSFGTADSYKLDANYRKMADFLGLKGEDRDDVEIAQKVAYLRDSTHEKDELDAMIKVRDMIRSLGLQMQGKELLVNLYQYARLAEERTKIDKEISLIQNNGREHPTTTGQV